MESIALDSNAFIAYRSGDTKIRSFIESAQLLFLPMTVMGELLYGAKNSTRIAENVQAVYEFSQLCMPVYIDESIAARYAEIRHHLKQKGSPIPENDIWIAASCLEVEAALLTQDNHFSGIEGLVVLGW